MTNQVAQTILQQLGGRRFLAMTGAKNLTAHESALSLKINGRTTDGTVNHVKITLMADDTYMVEASRIRQRTLKPVAIRTGVYCDTLQTAFTELTGLYTRL